MKRHWLEHLGDPQTGDLLSLQAVFRECDGHIMDGLLCTEAGRRYPSMRGVPVFVDNVGELYGGWIEEHREALGEVSHDWSEGAYEVGTRRVQDSFGYEWSPPVSVSPSSDKFWRPCYVRVRARGGSPLCILAAAGAFPPAV